MEVLARTRTTSTETTGAHTQPLPEVITEGALGFAGFVVGEVETNGEVFEVVTRADDPLDEGNLGVGTTEEASSVTTTVEITVTPFLRVVTSGFGPLDIEVTHEDVEGFDSIDELVKLLNQHLLDSPLAGALTAAHEDERIIFTSAALGSDIFILAVGETRTQVATTTVFSDGSSIQTLNGTSIFGALGFDEDVANGMDRSYLVGEVPFAGWTPTVGITSTPDGPIGIQEILFEQAGEIVEGVDFGNFLVVDLEMGKDFTANEGDLVTLNPEIVDPLGRPGNPYSFVWQIESDNGQIIADGDQSDFNFVPFDNGLYRLRLFITDHDRGLEAYPGEIFVTSLNVPPSFEAGDDRSLAEGELLEVIIPFTDPGTNDTHTATINWGDGSLIDESIVISEINGSGDLTGSHVFADDGVYTVSVTLTDDDGGSTTDTFEVTVSNAMPTLDLGPGQQIGEGEVFQFSHEIIAQGEGEDIITLRELGARFNDPGTLDTHTAVIDWGDGTPLESATIAELPTGPPGSVDGLDSLLLGSHVYADDGEYVVTVTLTDDDEAVVVGMLTLTVQNVAPVIVPLETQFDLEGNVVMLPPVRFNDPGTLDTHTATINWGDGTATEDARVEEMPSGPPGSNEGMMGAIHAGHVYADDGIYTVNLTLIDDDGGTATETLSFEVEIANVLPNINAGDNQTVFEGEQVELASILTDPGTLDTHTAEIDWGDGNTTPGDVVAIPFGPPGDVNGLTGIVNGTHAYVDEGVYEVVVMVADDDGAEESVVMDQLLVTVVNAAPVVDAGEDVVGLEGTPIEIAASFTDAGILDTHTALIDWGDGTQSDADVDPLGRIVTGTHIFADSGPHVITVIVTDNDGDTGSSSLIASIGNVAPEMSELGEDRMFEYPAEVTLDPLTFTDAGTLDTHIATIDWGDGSALELGTVDEVPTGPPGSETAANGMVTFGSHIYETGGIFTVTVTLTDDNGGETVDSLTVISLPLPRQFPFVEIDGMVVMEAESYSESRPGSTHEWIESDATPDFTGSGAMFASPNNGTLLESVFAVVDGPALDYQVNFEATGDYRLWIRGKGATAFDNSVHAGINGLPGTQFISVRDDGQWDWDFVVIKVLSPGIHTINLWMREDGFYVDRLILTDDPSLIPSTTFSESPRQLT